MDQETFREACARWSTGVTVATAVGSGGEPFGLTVSAFTPVSWNPRLVMVSVDHRATVYRHFLSAPAFAVHVLAEDQKELSVRFATPGEDRFAGLEWKTGETGAPILPGSLAEFECTVADRIHAGDHTLFIGDVKRAAFREDRPLVYFQRHYRRLTS